MLFVCLPFKFNEENRRAFSKDLRDDFRLFESAFSAGEFLKSGGESASCFSS